MRRLGQAALAVYWVCLGVPWAAAQIDLQPPIPPPSRIPEPSAAAQKEAEKTIRSLFKAEYAKQAPDAMKAFARKLLEQAEGTKEDVTARYVLLREARDIAAAAGDPETVLSAVDSLAAGYALDPLALRLAAMSAVGRTIRTPEASVALARRAHAAAEAAVAADDYETAAAFAQRAAAAARTAKDPILLEAVQARVREISEIRIELARVQVSIKKLADAPEDPEANLTVGRFRCFVIGAWDAGLPLLARGSDPALKDAAVKDLKGPSDGAACLEAADPWWALAEKESSKSAKAALIMRAVYWYEKAVPQMTGLNRLKVEERLKQAAKMSGVQIAPAAQVMTADAFQKIATRFPAKQNVAGSGKASAFSHYWGRDPQNVLKGLRSGHQWTLDGPNGWFEATWEPPVRGRTLLFFGRTSPPGADPWGQSKVTINGGTVIELKGMSGSHVAVIDLGRAIYLRSVRIVIAGQTYPGLAGLEIHP
jgi:hypothetical protein